MDEKKTLMTWLNDAYAMEQSIVETLEGHEKDAADFPKVQSMIREHLELTKNQADRLRGEIEHLGGDVSTIKSGSAKLMGMVQGLVPDLAMDKVVKNAIVEHATEHFEHASYLALAEAADYFGEPELAATARGIMQEELDMGKRLEEDLPGLVREYLDQEENK